uniref:Adhesion G protein-coupled receptor F3b n=1 Tax=Myripristis murdjan TaxID=586833 RepID=A0A667XVQ0_9TELE
LNFQTVSNALSNDSFEIATPLILLNKTAITGSFSADLNSSVVIDVSVPGDPSSTITTITFASMDNVLPARNASNSTINTINGNVVLVNFKGSINNVSFSFDIINETLGNPQCVFWNFSLFNGLGGWDDEGCEVNKSDDGRITCQCDHLTSFSVLMSKKPVELPFLKEITYVGLGVSICSLLVLLIIEALVWSAVVKTNLSHFRHTALVNISLCLFLADCSFIASSFPEILNGTSCLILTVCKHFFFLSMFGWAMSLSIMLVHQLIFVFNPLRKRVFMFFSSIVGYVCPVIIVGTSYVYYKYTGSPYHSDKCWLIFDGLLKGSMHAFLIPVGIVLMTNVFSMVVVILTLMKSSSPDSSKAEDKDTAKSILKVVVFLTPVFGITWILGFLQLFLSDAGPPLFEIIHYSFTILNSFQGFFIFLTGCFAEQKVGFFFFFFFFLAQSVVYLILSLSAVIC